VRSRRFGSPSPVLGDEGDRLLDASMVVRKGTGPKAKFTINAKGFRLLDGKLLPTEMADPFLGEEIIKVEQAGA
jgi:hypothetical protein